MATQIDSTQDLSRVIILGEEGPLGGDLVAWLSGSFCTELARTADVAWHSLLQPAQALIMVPPAAPGFHEEYRRLANRALDFGCRVIFLGEAVSVLGRDVALRTVNLPAFPEPGTLIRCLGRPAGSADSSEA